MIRGLYTSAMGLAVQDKRQELVANNLVNANTVGYKKETLASEAFPNMLIQILNDPENPSAPVVGNLSTGTRINDIVIDHSSGTIRESNDPYEMALQGEGYFVIATPAGERYTRNGQFRVDSTGNLVTADGYAVMGQNGEINLARANGNIQVSTDGTISSNGQIIDRFRVVTLNGEIIKEGSSLFRGTDAQEVELPTVIQGFVEESNTSALQEMVNMISAARAYETNAKMVQIHDSTLEKAVNEVGQA